MLQQDEVTAKQLEHEQLSKSRPSVGNNDSFLHLDIPTGVTDHEGIAGPVVNIKMRNKSQS